MRTVLLALLFAACGMLNALPINEPDHGFRTEIHDGFEEVRIGSSNPDLLRSFVEKKPVGHPISVQILLLPNEIPRQTRNTTADPGALEFTTRWKDFELVRVQRKLEFPEVGHCVEVSVRVPVAKRAVELRALGIKRREVEVIGQVEYMLERFEAKSNWKLESSVLEAPVRSGGETEPSAAADNTTAWVVALMVGMGLSFAAGWTLRSMGLGASPKVQAPAAPASAPKRDSVPSSAQISGPARAMQASPEKKASDTDPGIVEPAKCHYCGEPVRPGRKVCMNCGTQVMDSPGKGA